MDNTEDDLLKNLNMRESQSRFDYDPDVEDHSIPEWIENKSTPEFNGNFNVPQDNTQNQSGLGRVNVNRTPMGMENEWKNLPPESLPSKGFGYPEGFEIAIKSAGVREIRRE